LHHATFMVLLLSRHAVTSSWVEREWRAAHWNEIESNSVALLPVLFDDCDIPPLLRTKKYADFRASFDDGR
ncbi:MAG TPA: toll/interleukin-1 receptor domain-containing protein, partial [Thermoanaerobaculia bacterium]